MEGYNKFSQFPWVGGANTSLDPSTIPPNQLVEALNLVFGTKGSRKKRQGVTYNWDNAATTSNKVLAGIDFWYGSTTRTQKLVTVHFDKSIYSYSGGAQSANLFAGTAWSSSITKASLEVMLNHCIISVDGAGNVPKKFDGTTVTDLAGAQEISTVTTVADVAGSLGGKYFDVYDESGAVRIWYNTGASAAPATPGGGRLLQVSIIAGDSANTVATKTNTAINLDTKIFATAVAAVLTITCVLPGPRTDTSAGTSGFTVVVFRQGALAPQFSISRMHAGRLFADDKTRLDYLNFSTAGNDEEWGGAGDSGAIPIGLGDGDPEGLTAIFPSFKGALFISKRTKLYRLDVADNDPANFLLTTVSNGIGCVSHNSVCAADQDDVYYVSDRGVHSLSTTNAYGDFIGAYVSFDIQETFNNLWVKARRKYIWGAYISEINSIAFAVTDKTVNETANNTLWLYNIPLKSWYYWSTLSSECMFVVNDADMKRVYLGSNTGRLGKSFNGANYDVSTSGAQTAIQFRAKTGIIFTDNSPDTAKSFGWFALHYKPVGVHSITVTVKIDNYPIQSFTFSQSTGSDLLGSTFILGSSILGSSFVMAPYSIPIDGFGRGIQVTLEQSGTDQEIEIQGFSLGWKSADRQQEVIGTQS